MKIVIASDKFKGSLSSSEVAKHIEIGIRKVKSDVEIVRIPMGDGGEGTVQALADNFKGRISTAVVTDPVGRKIESFFGIIEENKTAIIEMAAASGLALLKEGERNPMKTTTYGFGQLIKCVLDIGCTNLIIGIGGSATNDGGAGMLKALGAKLLDKHGNEVGFGGENLLKITDIDISGMDSRITRAAVTVACDVDNPLCGPNGASYVYGPQKGASSDQIRLLDEGLLHFGRIIERTTGKSVADYPGAGAAGGLGAALIAFLNAELRRGIDLVIEFTGLEEAVKDADLVITGEGKIDDQTQFGKTPFGVAKIAKKYNLPVIAIAGSIGEGAEVLYRHGFDSIFSIIDKPMTLEQSVKESEALLEKAAERIFRTFMINLKD